MHGDIDQVVTIDGLLEAKDFFNKKDYKIDTKVLKIANTEFLLRDQV